MPMDISTPFVSHDTENSSLSLSQRLAERLTRSRRAAKTVPFSVGDRHVTVVCVSDTHNARPALPDGDILLHAGDLSQYGMFAEIQSQLDWLASQPHRHKVVIAGNHDLLLDRAFVQFHPDRELNKLGQALEDLNWHNIIYLQDDSTTLDVDGRSITVFGSPWTPKCGIFAFQHERDEDIWDRKVPDGIDILLTHGPPATLLDNGKGCRHLLREIWRARPHLIVFGHIHEACGSHAIDLSPAQRQYQEIMLGGGGYLALLHMLLLIARERVLLSSRRLAQRNTIRLVNAALDQRNIPISNFKAIEVSL